MSNTSTIEWTNATWNPITGCTEVSPGCDHCYARTFSERFRGTPGHHFEQGFDLKLWPDRLDLPMQWKKPQRIFVNSMSDLFHKDVPLEYIIHVFETMIRANHHTYQVLTKRPSRLNTSTVQSVLSGIFGSLTGKREWPSHIWLGTSIENQNYTWRADALRKVDAPIRFISAEPLLGPLELDLTGISWLITGAESGHGARPMNEDWVRSLRDQCQAASTAFFYKQNAVKGRKIPLPELDGKIWNEYPIVEQW